MGANEHRLVPLTMIHNGGNGQAAYSLMFTRTRKHTRSIEGNRDELLEYHTISYRNEMHIVRMGDQLAGFTSSPGVSLW